MLFLTSRELDRLIFLKTNWRTLYQREIARYLNDDAVIFDLFKNIDPPRTSVVLKNISGDVLN
jgi:hypothetical protein